MKKKGIKMLLFLLVVSLCWMPYGNFSQQAMAAETVESANATVKTSDSTDVAADYQRKLLMHLGSRQVSITDAEGTVEEITLEVMPLFQNGRTLVPLRFICEEVLCCQVDYLKETETIQLTRKDLSAVVDLNSRVVEVEYSNGVSDTPEMDQMPLLRNGYTYMPLRFFSELFGCRVDYFPTDQSISILDRFDPESDVDVVTRPVARAEFDPYTVGQPELTFTDESSDPNGAQITKRQWRLVLNGQTIISENVSELAAQIDEEGVYTFRYRVCNENQVWSGWISVPLKVSANQDPVISGLSAVKSSNHNSVVINSGEPIDFVYEIENEEWEEIVEEEWTCLWTSNGYKKHLYTKPEVLYAADGCTYEITLRVKDAAGNWGSQTISVVPRANSQYSEAAYKFEHLSPGEIFLNDKKTDFFTATMVEPENLNFYPVTLLASNNPETVPENGILEADTISGDARLRFHHTNDTGHSVKFYAIAKNETDYPILLRVGQIGSAGPSTDVIHVGSQVVVNYLTKSYQPVTKLLQPGETYLINANAPTVRDGYTMSNLIDVSANGPLAYTICCMNATDSYSAYSTLPKAEKNSTHIRGTFPYSSMSMDYTFSGRKVEKISLGKDDAFDGYYRTGIDALTGEEVVNKGNRGVVHHFTITAERNIGLLLNPRGTYYKGSIMIDGEIVELSTNGMVDGINEACVLDVMKAGETKEFTYVVPSGSDSPILIVAIPESQWEQY